jgi:hypothetical protein
MVRGRYVLNRPIDGLPCHIAHLPHMVWLQASFRLQGLGFGVWGFGLGFEGRVYGLWSGITKSWKMHSHPQEADLITTSLRSF